MKYKKLLYIVSLLLFFNLGSFSLFTDWFSENLIQNQNESVIKKRNLKTSGSWILTNPIRIDDSDPSKNWSKTANDNDWCSGSGTWSDPYVIKNIWMNISQTCIEIKNSNVHFRIWNSSLLTSIFNGIVLLNVNNSNIYNNKISAGQSFGEGISLIYSNNNSIGNNFIWDSNIGIRIINGSRNWMTSNIIKNSFYHGITFEDNGNSQDSFIYNNTLINNHPGVFLRGKYHTLLNNSFTGAGIIFGYDFDEIISYNIDTSNKIDNKPIYYYSNKTYLNPEDFVNGGQILLANVNNSRIENLRISNAGLGIQLGYCFNLRINNVSLTNQIYGMGLSDSYNNTFSKISVLNNGIGIWLLGDCENNNFINNEFTNNSHAGVKSGFSDDNLFLNNLFKDNDYGLYFYNGDRNIVYRNVFINNTVNAFNELEGILNFWDNGILGNYWDDYNGTDLNLDGIGDTPYNISGATGNQDNFPLINFPHPEISIIKPSENNIFGVTPPEYEISFFGFNIDTMWYTIDSGLTIVIFSINGSIDSVLWDALPDGIVTLTFFANDTAGNVNFTSVNIIKDTLPPEIQILSPNLNDIFGINPPTFELSINESNLVSTWYTIDGGITNYTFSGLTGMVNQIAWNNKGSGLITISFYANDSLGHIGFKDVQISKDIVNPVTFIYIPLEDGIFGTTPPNFNISITEVNLVSTWYTIDGGLTNITFSGLIGLIDQDEWYVALEGQITITFYAQDRAGNIGTETVIVIKRIPPSPSILGYNIYLLFGIVFIGLIFSLQKKHKPIIS